MAMTTKTERITKKTERILNELQKKLEMYTRIYEHECEPYGFIYHCLNEVCNDCLKMVSLMRYFHLLNGKDVKYLNEQIINLTNDYNVKLNSLYAEKHDK